MIINFTVYKHNHMSRNSRSHPKLDPASMHLILCSCHHLEDQNPSLCSSRLSHRSMTRFPRHNSCAAVALFCAARQERPIHDCCIARKRWRRSWRRSCIHNIYQMSQEFREIKEIVKRWRVWGREKWRYGLGIRHSLLCRWLQLAQLAKGKKSRP